MTCGRRARITSCLAQLRVSTDGRLTGEEEIVLTVDGVNIRSLLMGLVGIYG